MQKKDFVRINKFLSEIGYCSRREADRLINQQKVKINGETPQLGTKISSDDEVTVNGEVVHRSKNQKRIYIVFNKPVGIVCTTIIREKK